MDSYIGPPRLLLFATVHAANPVFATIFHSKSLRFEGGITGMAFALNPKRVKGFNAIRSIQKRLYFNSLKPKEVLLQLKQSAIVINPKPVLVTVEDGVLEICVWRGK